MQFPPWAPAVLCSLYRTNFEDPNIVGRGPYRTDAAKGLFEKLLSDQRMPYVWDEIKNQIQKRYGAEFEEHLGGAMIGVVMCTVEAHYQAHLSPKSRREKRDGFRRISVLSKRLVEELRSLGVKDTPVYRWFPDLALRELVEHVVAEKVKPVGPDKRDLRESLAIILAERLTNTPSIRRFLQELRDGYAREAKHLDEIEKSKRVSTKRKVIFVRFLADRFRGIFDSPLYGTVATITSVALNEDIDKPAVREILKNK